MVSHWTIDVVVMLALVSAASALKCYKCKDCANQSAQVEECSYNYDTCMKIDLSGHVIKGCSRRVECSLGTIERGAVDAWNSVKNWIANLHEDIEVPQDAQARVVGCCEHDYCNSAVTKLMNPLLLLLPLMMYYLQC
ncbi:hypothetical protein OTU49_014818 [Cherax quadricarinatus]|uniref:Protein quiver n=1 Tax=Cherax quadricarinatus TaxID=27406 RepID=A0AAW0Y0S8_CHEQU|nr:uncharacterized protein LOC128686756 [Cherax quadricarinatus]XP_053629770.1 uncharacterized protein LOC128686756 [Cherax quadricarinatus]